MFRLLQNVFEKFVHIVNSPLILIPKADFPNLHGYTGVVTAKAISG
jgi:hypothetical protein